MDFSTWILWHVEKEMYSKEYTCAHCGLPLASASGFNGEVYTMREGHKTRFEEHGLHAAIYICHHCTRPTFFGPDDEQIPGACYGVAVNGITDAAVSDLYGEARRATSAGCYTAAVLCCRKLLMHIAVAKSAKEGEPFASYVDYLASKGYVPPDATDCVDHIRKKGNEANHQINIMKPDDAEELLDYVGILLKLIYEYPATMRKKHPPAEGK
jgi:hypothetical protein